MYLPKEGGGCGGQLGGQGLFASSERVWNTSRTFKTLLLEGCCCCSHQMMIEKFSETPVYRRNFSCCLVPICWLVGCHAWFCCCAHHCCHCHCSGDCCPRRSADGVHRCSWYEHCVRTAKAGRSEDVADSNGAGWRLSCWYWSAHWSYWTCSIGRHSCRQQQDRSEFYSRCCETWCFCEGRRKRKLTGWHRDWAGCLCGIQSQDGCWSWTPSLREWGGGQGRVNGGCCQCHCQRDRTFRISCLWRCSSGCVQGCFDKSMMGWIGGNLFGRY